VAEHDPEGRASANAYVERVIDSGDFPHLAALGAEGLLPDDKGKEAF
jgi:hypothetical protein